MSGGNKSARREQAIAALLTESTIEQAAAKVGISARTLKAWLAEAGFQADYRLARRRGLDKAVRLLQRAAEAATAALIKQLTADQPADVIRAATAILDRAFRGTEILDLAEAVEALRHQVEEAKHVYRDAHQGSPPAGGHADGVPPRPALPGPAESGPGAPAERRGDDGRFVAGGPAPLWGEDDDPPLFPSER
jgi:hypothetical protein